MDSIQTLTFTIRSIGNLRRLISKYILILKCLDLTMPSHQSEDLSHLLKNHQQVSLQEEGVTRLTFLVYKLLDLQGVKKGITEVVLLLKKTNRWLTLLMQ